MLHQLVVPRQEPGDHEKGGATEIANPEWWDAGE